MVAYELVIDNGRTEERTQFSQPGAAERAFDAAKERGVFSATLVSLDTGRVIRNWEQPD